LFNTQQSVYHILSSVMIPAVYAIGVCSWSF